MTQVAREELSGDEEMAMAVQAAEKRKLGLLFGFLFGEGERQNGEGKGMARGPYSHKEWRELLEGLEAAYGPKDGSA